MAASLALASVHCHASRPRYRFEPLRTRQASNFHERRFASQKSRKRTPSSANAAGAADIAGKVTMKGVKSSSTGSQPGSMPMF